jgi:alkanesulfonate monooxygenase SsuD/methylene tetrahydromethanopterin reductase-like flavin-dependent oxidoreductase (luciferase family)
MVSPRPRFGLVITNHEFPLRRVLDLAVAAEDAGFDELWLSSQLWPLPGGGSAWPILARIGSCTRSIALCAGVPGRTATDTPNVIASSFGVVSAFYPGRVHLALGADDTRWLQRVTGAVRRVAGGNSPPKIYVAGDTQCLAEFAGSNADGWIAGAHSLGRLGAAFRRGASFARRDPDELPVLVQLHVVVGDTADLEYAVGAGSDPPVGLAELLGSRKQGATGLVRFNPFRGWLLGEEPAVHVQAIRKLVAAGATDLYIQSGQRNLTGVIQFYGRRVLPLVRAGTA